MHLLQIRYRCWLWNLRRRQKLRLFSWKRWFIRLLSFFQGSKCNLVFQRWMACCGQQSKVLRLIILRLKLWRNRTYFLQILLQITLSRILAKLPSLNNWMQKWEIPTRIGSLLKLHLRSCWLKFDTEKLLLQLANCKCCCDAWLSR